jgi:predicted small lipoprotein YifL
MRHILVSASFAVLAGCGQKGPLYLPPPAPAAQSRPPPVEPAAERPYPDVPATTEKK